MNKAIFNMDLHNEQVLASYLDQYFYPKLEFLNVTRVTNKEEQFRGIDIRLDNQDREYLVDEKGYLSRPTIQDTFVLELSFINPGNERVEGWFYSPKKDSTHYLLCWADRDNINIYNPKQPLVIDNLHRVEIMLVNRFVLQEYLNKQYGINRQFIEEHHNKLLRNLENRSIRLPNSASKYQLIRRLQEKSLCIVMTKKEYVASGAIEGRYIVYRDKIEEIQ